jgi:hypothetical protein
MSPQSRPARPQHEATDAHPRVVLAIAGALAFLIGAALLVGRGYVRSHGTVPTAVGFQYGPQERTSVSQAWADYQRDTAAHLAGYGWIDRRAGTVRVPLDRAIDLVAAGEARKSP